MSEARELPQGAATDLRKHDRAELLLKPEVSFFLDQIAQHPTAQLLVDVEADQIIYANSAACRLSGISPEQLNEVTLSEMFLLAGGSSLNEWERVLDGSPESFVASLLCQPEGIRQVRIHGHRFEHPDVSGLVFCTVLDESEHRNARQLQSVLIDIAEVSSTTNNLIELVDSLRERLTPHLNTKYFQIVLADQESGLFHHPYVSADFDASLVTTTLERHLVQLIAQNDRPIRAGRALIEQMKRLGEVKHVGKIPAVWLGVPLRTPEGVIGVLNVIDPDHSETYTEFELQLLEYISVPITALIERSRAEEASKNSDKRFQTFFELSAEGIWAMDLLEPVPVSLPMPEQIREIARFGHFIECNQTFVDMYGFKAKKEVYGKKLDDIPARTDKKKSNAGLSRFISHGYRMTDGESWEFTHDGDLKVFMNQLIGVIEDERLVRIWGAQREITPRIKAQQELEVQKAHLERFITNSQEGIVFTNSDDIVVAMNDAFKEMFGYTSDEMLGKPNKNIVPEHLYSEGCKLAERATKGENICIDTVRQHRDGYLIDVSLLGTPVYLEKVSYGTYWVYRDITQRRRTERIQEVLYHIAEETSRSSDLNALLKTVHHQVGTLIDTTNFYVALHEGNGSTYRFHYFVDANETVESEETVYELPNSLTDHVRKEGTTLLKDRKEIEKAYNDNGLSPVGPMAQSWLGVPLRTPDGVLGVVVVQCYTREDAYDQSDVDLLEYVSGHIASAIEHKRWQDTIRKSEQKYRTLYDQNPAGVLVFDSDLRVLDCNEQFNNLFQLDSNFLSGRSLTELCRPAIVQIAREAAVGKPNRFTGEFNVSFKNKILWVNGNVAPLYDAEGQVNGGLFLLEDLTEQKKTSFELELQRAHTEHLFSNAPEAIVMLDPKAHVIRVNDEFKCMFGFNEEELIGKKLHHYILLEGGEEEKDGMVPLIERGKPFNHETKRMKRDGTSVDVSILGAPIYVKKRLIAYYLIYRDITERKRSERLQAVLYHIAKAAVAVPELDEFLEIVHTQLSQLINAKNFSVSLYSSKRRKYSFPFHRDAVEYYSKEKEYSLTKTLIDYVRRNGKPQMLKCVEIKSLVECGIIKERKNCPKVWLGIPLRSGDDIIGVVKICDYDSEETIDQSDMELLEFVSDQIANMIEHKWAEVALAVSEEKYRSLFDQSPIGVVLYDENLRIKEVNERFTQIIGKDSESLIEVCLEDLLSASMKEGLERSLKGDNVAFEDRIEVDNEELWLNVRMTPHFTYEGNVSGGIGVFQDFTDRQKAEKLAEMNQIYLEQLFGGAPEAIIMLDPVFKVIRMNKESTTMFGYTIREAIGKKLPELVFAENGSFVSQMEVLRKVAKGETAHLEEAICRTKDGGYVDVSLMATPIVMDGEVIALYAIYRDITVRKKAVEALAEEKERLSVTLSSIGDAVITTDTRGRIIMMNQAASVMTEWEKEEAVGRPFEEVFPLKSPGNGRCLESPVFQVIKNGYNYSWNREFHFLSKNGARRSITGSASPMHDGDQRVVGVVVVVRDVSAQRKMEDEISKIERLESVGVLAGGIAHDFNNILSAVLGNISIAKMAVNNEEMHRQRIDEAERAALRARDLTQQLLTFSRGGEPIRKTASISELIQEATTFALRGSNVGCEINIAENLASADVDEGQISRVINNLVINADQAMPNGGMVKIAAENIDIGEDSLVPLATGEYVKISIMDTGVGIPDDLLQRIFDPFFTTKQKGSGLGLATSFSIIQKHDGLLTVDSEVGKGTTFYIYLPVSDQGTEEVIEIEAEEYRGSGKILVMDDEESVLEVIAVMLEQMGFETETAVDGASAIEKYQQARMIGEPFRAVIMDLTIPGGMGGEQAIKHLKKLDPCVRAIVASGYSNDPVMSNHREYGFIGVVAKPFGYEDLARVMSTVLPVKR